MCNDKVEGRENGRSWDDRVRDSILITNTGDKPITLMGLDGVGRHVEPGDSFEYVRAPDPKVVEEILDAEPAGQTEALMANELIPMRRTPLFVELALGFHTLAGYQPPPFPAQREICRQMVKLGLLKEDPVEGARHSHYVPVVAALEIYVNALLEVPLPVKRWVMP